MLAWLMTTPPAEFVGSNAWAQQALETVHMIAFSAMIGAIAVADVRLLRGRSPLPANAYWPLVAWIAWIAMLVLVFSGALMFLPRAEGIAMRVAFQVKLSILALALLNLIYVQTRTGRLVRVGGGLAPVPGGLQAMAVVSLLLWASVVIVGRFMYAIDQMLGTTR